MSEIRISRYEWDKLESGETIAGLSSAEWYKHFIFIGDLYNLSKLCEFYNPPIDLVDNLIEIKGELTSINEIKIVTDTRLIKMIQNRPEMMFKISPREFEFFVAELLEKLDYTDIKLGQGSKDGGVDISATIKNNIGIEKILVQCKRFSEKNKVGEPIIKQLLYEVDMRKATRGVIVTTSTLTKPAHTLITSFLFRLSAIENDGIMRMLKEIKTFQ